MRDDWKEQDEYLDEDERSLDDDTREDDEYDEYDDEPDNRGRFAKMRDSLADWWDDLPPERRSFTRFLLTFVIILAIFAVCFFMFVFKGCSTETPQEVSESSAAVEASSSESAQSNEEAYKETLHSMPENVYEQLGLDAKRIEQDTAIIEEFCQTAFTFASAEEYGEARQKLVDGYPFFADSQFATEFMPDVYQTISSTIEYRSVNCYATAAKENGTYSYACDVYVTIKSSNGGSIQGDIVLCCDVNSQGQLKAIQAYPAMSL